MRATQKNVAFCTIIRSLFFVTVFRSLQLEKEDHTFRKVSNHPKGMNMLCGDFDDYYLENPMVDDLLDILLLPYSSIMKGQERLGPWNMDTSHRE